MNGFLGLYERIKKSKKTVHIYAAIIIFIIGITIMLFSSTKNEENRAKSVSDAVLIQMESCEQRLEEILAKIDGVSEPEVMVAFETFQNTSSENDWYSKQETKKNEFIRGVVVVCRGADNVKTRQKIIEAVCAATGVYEHNVGVFEKNN